jgi:hypothetical protein
MEVLILLDRNDATKTGGVLWSLSLDQFQIFRVNCIQKFGSPKTLLLLKVLFLQLLQLYFTHWA